MVGVFNNQAMTEQLISYDLAKLAKEKGFNGDCFYHYDPDDKLLYENSSILYISCEGGLNTEDHILSNPYKDIICAPTQSLLAKWLRDIHGWHILVIPVVTMAWTYKIIKVWKKDFDPELEIETPPYKGVNAYDYSSYEEALEEGLKEGLKLVTN
jgi:hypothetical protein